MERCYTIKEHSELYDDYFKWKHYVHSMQSTFNRFASKHSIESRRVSATRRSLCFIPTEADTETFADQLEPVTCPGNFRAFRQNSVIGKAWKESAKIMPDPCPYPMVAFYLEHKGRLCSRLFDYKDVLYCYLKSGKDSEEDFSNIPEDTFLPIPSNEYWNVVEKMNAAAKVSNN